MTHAHATETFLNWLLNTSLQAGLLVLVVLAVQALLRDRLSARWRYALWWLVLLRLLLPVSPRSSVSLFNVVRPEVEVSGPRYFVDPGAAHQHLREHTPSTPVSEGILPAPDIATSMPPGYDWLIRFHPGYPGYDPGEPIPALATSPMLPTPVADELAANTATVTDLAAWSKRSPLPIILWGWAAVAAMLFGLGLVQSLRFHFRLRRSFCRQVPEAERLLEDCRERFGVRRAVALAESDAVESPVVCGLFRLRVLLPPGMTQGFTGEELRHVFLHELAHVRRGDLWLNWLLALLQAVHWFNPLLWYGMRRLRADRELACDDLALRHAGLDDARAYGRTIIKLLEGLPRPELTPGAAGILEDGRQMKRRIAMVVRFRKPSQVSVVLALLLIVGLAAVTLTDAQDAASQPPPGGVGDAGQAVAPAVEEAEHEARLHLEVVDAQSGAGLAGARIQANYFHPGGHMEGLELVTDDAGRLAIPPSKESPDPSGFNLFVTATGHLPKVASWRQGAVPKSHRMALDLALTVTGTVVDDEGVPVPGVTINISRPGLPDEWSIENVDFHPRQSAVVSDEAGRWTCPYVPKTYKDLPLILTHPDFAVTRVSVALTGGALTGHTLVLERGFEVAGSVRDEAGAAVDGAVVRELHNFGQRKLEATTGEDGAFSMRGLRGDAVTLVVQAEGYAPQLREVPASDAGQPLVFTLTPGHVFRGRVRDASGQPLTNAVVQTDWDNQGLRKVAWSARTDAEGRFEWRSAPADPLLFWFEAAGYEVRRNVLLTADGVEHDMILQRREEREEGSFTVSGTVRDVVTDRPIPVFKVLIGERRHEFSTPDYRSLGTMGQDGAFRLPIQTPCGFQTYVVQVQAPGYLPRVSTNLVVGDGDQSLDFELRPGDGLAGEVRLADGLPAMGASVHLCGLQGSVYMDQPAQVRRIGSQIPQVETGVDGRFQFEPMADAHTIIIVHPDGYAEFPVEDLDSDKPITLSPYGRVEGTLLVDGRPAADEAINVTIVLYRYADGRRNFAPLSLWLQETTDAEGRFVFEKVPPGERKVVHRMVLKEGRMGTIPLSHPVTVEVPAGGTIDVTLGGTGRPVIGRVVVPGHEEEIDWRNDVQWLQTKMEDPPDLVRPNREAFESDQLFMAASKDFSERYKSYWMSPEGRARERERQVFVARFSEDGSFRINDVPAGEYELRIKVSELRETSLGPSRGPMREGPEIGSLTWDVIVPPVEGRRSDEPLDLGELALNVKVHLKAGHEAPAFEIATLEGQPLKLSDYRGRYVLLDFWATWCGPCVQELPHLEETFKAFGGDERFAMIGLSLDYKADAARRFVSERELGWVQGFLGPWSKTDIPQQFGVTGIPSLVLIDPEGKIVATGLRGASVKAAVEQALAR